MAGVTGGCACGAVRYTLALDDLPPVYLCHCGLCQRASGSAFAEQALLPASVLAVDGQTVTRDFTRTNGSVSTHYFCGACNTRLYNRNSLRPKWVVVRAGTLDRCSELSPRAHIWASRKQPWLVLDPAVPAWAEGPELERFAAVLGGVRP